MKNVFKTFSLVFILTISMLSTNIFASDFDLEEVSSTSTIEIDNIQTDIVVDESEIESLEFTETSHKGENDSRLRGSAPQVSRVTPLNVYINSRGNVIMQVLVMGDGAYNANLNGMTAKYIGWYDTVGRNPVSGWYEEFDCGPAYRGYHTFNITARSYNYPYTSRSASVSFTIY